VVLTM